MTSGEPMPKYVVEPASARPRSMQERTKTNSSVAPPSERADADEQEAGAGSCVSVRR